MNMKECSGWKCMCCEPICNWEEYCWKCQKAKDLEEAGFNHGDLYEP